MYACRQTTCWSLFFHHVGSGTPNQVIRIGNSAYTCWDISLAPVSVPIPFEGWWLSTCASPSRLCLSSITGTCHHTSIYTGLETELRVWWRHFSTCATTLAFTIAISFLLLCYCSCVSTGTVCCSKYGEVRDSFGTGAAPQPNYDTPYTTY